MLKKSLVFLLLLSLVRMAYAQEGVDILVKFDNYSYDTLWFGHTFGKRAVPEFFGLKNSDGYFELKHPGPLTPGMYAIIHKRSANANFQFFQCWVAEGQRAFTLETNLAKPYANARIKGSPENERFYRYLDQADQLGDLLDSLINHWRYQQDEPSFRQRVKAEEEFSRFQEDFIQKNAGTLTANLIGQIRFPVPPPAKIKYADWKEEALQRWLWQRQHYFDRMDISQPGFHQYVQWLNATDFYLLNLPPPDPDTLKVLLDEVFGRLAANPDALGYYQKYLINSLARMSQFRLDEVFVYLVRNYVQPGKAAWGRPEDMQKLITDADRMEPLFTGKKAPDIRLFDRQNNPVSLYEIEAPCTILVFWLPDCSHCKRELPLLKQIYSRYKQNGLKVMSVCGKMADELPACWEFNDSREMPGEWFSVADPQRCSGMTSLYNLRTYPRIFVLDAEKNIVYKRAGEAGELELETAINKALNLGNH